MSRWLAQTTGGPRRRARLGPDREYTRLPYSNIDQFVSDVAALVRSFPSEMKRKTGKKTTILKSLTNSVQPVNLEYLANHARFVARNTEVDVMNGTLPNEAFHRELKALFRNLMGTSPAKNHACSHSEVSQL